jgi:hypothetical protein
VPLFRTGWASGDIVVAHGAEFRIDVVEDAEFGSTSRSPYHWISPRFWGQELRWDGLPGNQSRKLFTGHLGKCIQVAHLLLKVFTGTVKPETLTCAPVNAQRTTDGIAVPAGLQGVLFGEDLDAFPLLPVFDWNAEPHGQIADIYAELTSWQRFGSEEPEVPATTAVL